MKALSIRQPWAWLILHAGKDIENRTWFTNLRGKFLIHASAGMTKHEYEEARLCAIRICPAIVPSMRMLERGGIVGEVEIVACVSASQSPWFFGPWGFVLRNAKPLPFRPYTGTLGFFEVKE